MGKYSACLYTDDRNLYKGMIKNLGKRGLILCFYFKNHHSSIFSIDLDEGNLIFFLLNNFSQHVP